MFHKVVRKVALALQRSEANHLLKKLNKVFRFSRAPFSTAKFGKSLGSARQQLANALKQGKADELADMWIEGVARDLSKDVSFLFQAGFDCSSGTERRQRMIKL